MEVVSPRVAFWVRWRRGWPAPPRKPRLYIIREDRLVPLHLEDEYTEGTYPVVLLERRDEFTEEHPVVKEFPKDFR